MNGRATLFAVAAVLAILLLACLVSARAEDCYMVEASEAIDGDNLRIEGVNVRLIGLDAPELYRPKCEAERRLAEKAQKRLWVLVMGPDVLACFNGTDRYGRPLARVYAAGVDVAEILISVGYARPYDGGKRRSWCRQ